jgi:uncharacterized DUF497 family protein
VQGGDYEWDDAKAALNQQRHGVTFEMTRDAFKDAFALEWNDERYPYPEPRFCLLGIVERRVLFVAYALNGDRIISARKAEPHERRRYHDENREA